MKKKSSVDWVLPGGAPGEVGYCTRCGRGLRMYMPVELTVAVAAMEAFVKVHARCLPGKHFEKPAVTPDQWAAGRDTGTSSLTIYSAITGNPSHHPGFDIPYDPADFGRCYRLLKLFPAWREQLAKTVMICKRWKPFVDAWDELTALYEEELPRGTAPKLYARMQQLEELADAA